MTPGQERTVLTIIPSSCNYCFLKTAIDFPDDLLHRAKVVAAERRTTLRELVVNGPETDLGPSAQVLQELNCHTLYSKDLNHGQDYGGAQGCNPFL